MKTKTLIISIILSFVFTNVCEAQLNLGKLINAGAAAVKATKEAKKKQKQLQENSASSGKVEETSEATTTPKHSIENPKDEVALTVSADGANKEEATKNALRSAIEQTYGAFVSANTTILNDDMLKDEIVTISTGNIKSYEELASAVLPNGRTTVTLNAIVSISKLTSYAQSKGATTEFAGASFAMNVKMMELNKKNEKKALDNLILQIKEILPTAFDMELAVGEPELAVGSNVSGNSVEPKFGNFPLGTEDSYKAKFNKIRTKVDLNNYYALTFTIDFKENENMIMLYNLIESTLRSLEPSDAECNYFKNTSQTLYKILGLGKNSPRKFKTRLSKEEVREYDEKINDIILDVFTDFEILDNTGQISSMDARLWATYWTMSDYESERLMLDKGYYMTEDYFWGERTGIFNPVVKNVYRISNHDLRSPFSNFCKGVYWHDYALPKYGIAFHFAVLIPKEDISKYSNFTVQHKTKK